MPQALDPAAYIFEGVWMNHGRTSISGWTLTLAPAPATLFTNALALFFALSGGQLWTIVRFVLHQWQAFPRTGKRRMIHHEEQIILRNATTDLTTTQLMWTYAWTSRRNGNTVTTCAPLNDTDHLRGWNGYVESPSTQPEHYVAYEYYGPSIVFSTNYTYAYSDYAAYYTNYSARATSSYQLYASVAYTPGGPRFGDFVPITELEQDAADLVLMFLSYTGNYLEPVDDPWFSAHRHHEINNTLYPYIDNQYARDLPISTLACTEQHRFCNPARAICTPLASSNDVQNLDSFSSNLTQYQVATFNRILAAMSFSILKARGRPFHYICQTTNGSLKLTTGTLLRWLTSKRASQTEAPVKLQQTPVIYYLLN
ncbi:hypothetical protein DV736_g3079, partial [Chaetothyriales sp. CBS 134916]